jgi:hypothetical protein
MARVPSYAKTTALVSRALKLKPEQLAAGFVPAAPQDLPQLVQVRKQIIGSELTWDDARYLSWRYHLGRPDEGRGECWVLKQGADVLAMLGTERIAVLHRGRVVDGLSVMDIAVRPDLDGVGLGVWMAMHLCEQTDCVLAIGSNTHSRAIVTHVFSRLPDRRSYAHPIDFVPMFNRRFQSRWFAASGAALAGWCMALWRGAVALTRKRSIQILPLQRFDASVADLVARSLDPPEISVERHAPFLNWRLFDSPRSAYSVWGAHDGGKLVGYAALRIKAFGDGTQALVVEDLLVPASEDGVPVLKALMLHAFEQATGAGCERISLIACHSRNEAVLRRLGFFVHRADAETLSIHCRDPQLSEALAQGARWHLTGANTDRDD